MNNQLPDGDYICDVVFEELDLSGMDLCCGKTFSSVTFKNCSFNECNLNNCSLEDCTFTNCTLTLTSVKNTKMQGVLFERSKLAGVRFFECNQFALKVNFAESIITGCNFSDMRLKNTNFSKSVIKESDFINTDLSGADFTESALAGSVFNNTNLTGAIFTGASEYSINPVNNTIKKAVFNLPEAISLLDYFKIIIK